jgi:hypothetical protein
MKEFGMPNNRSEADKKLAARLEAMTRGLPVHDSHVEAARKAIRDGVLDTPGHFGLAITRMVESELTAS